MYYMFGFVFLAFLMLLVVCAETSILLCYFHLCTEEYRWWWRAFFSSATSAFYLLLFCAHYFVYRLTIVGSLSYMLYFGYTFLAIFLFFIATGEPRLTPTHPNSAHTLRDYWVYIHLPVPKENLFHCEDRLMFTLHACFKCTYLTTSDGLKAKIKNQWCMHVCLSFISGL